MNTKALRQREVYAFLSRRPLDVEDIPRILKKRKGKR